MVAALWRRGLAPCPRSSPPPRKSTESGLLMSSITQSSSVLKSNGGAMTTISTPAGYIAGTWDIDPVHSEVSFQVRHLVVSKVRGRFDKFEGTVVTVQDAAQSSVQVTI